MSTKKTTTKQNPKAAQSQDKVAKKASVKKSEAKVAASKKTDGIDGSRQHLAVCRDESARHRVHAAGQFQHGQRRFVPAGGSGGQAPHELPHGPLGMFFVGCPAGPPFVRGEISGGEEQVVDRTPAKAEGFRGGGRAGDDSIPFKGLSLMHQLPPQVGRDAVALAPGGFTRRTHERPLLSSVQLRDGVFPACELLAFRAHPLAAVGTGKHDPAPGSLLEFLPGPALLGGDGALEVDPFAPAISAGTRPSSRVRD